MFQHEDVGPVSKSALHTDVPPMCAARILPIEINISVCCSRSDMHSMPGPSACKSFNFTGNQRHCCVADSLSSCSCVHHVFRVATRLGNPEKARCHWQANILYARRNSQEVSSQEMGACVARRKGGRARKMRSDKNCRGEIRMGMRGCTCEE